NLGRLPGLIAAAALLVDYVLTVSVSVAGGVLAITSAIPELDPQKVTIGVVFIGLLTIGNLRGIREAGLFFAGPTYFYVASVIGLQPDASETQSILSMLTRSLVGEGWYFYVVQIATTIILTLAANTSFSGFPRLASILATDRFMPRQFAQRGDRLAYSFGIIV